MFPPLARMHLFTHSPFPPCRTLGQGGGGFTVPSLLFRNRGGNRFPHSSVRFDRVRHTPTACMHPRPDARTVAAMRSPLFRDCVPSACCLFLCGCLPIQHIFEHFPPALFIFLSPVFCVLFQNCIVSKSSLRTVLPTHSNANYSTTEYPWC